MLALKKYVPVILSASVLIVAVYLPTALFQRYDNRLLGNVQTEAFLGLTPVKTDMLDTQSRLQLICGYGNNENIVVADKSVTETKQDEARLTSVVLNEIKSMQTVGAFPQLSLEPDMKLTLARTQTFTDISSAGKYVQISYLTFLSQKYSLQLIIDMETNRIYQYELGLNGALPGLDFSDLPSAFIKYLGINLRNSPNSSNNQIRYTTEDEQIIYTIETSNDGVIIQLLFGQA